MAQPLDELHDEVGKTALTSARGDAKGERPATPSYSILLAGVSHSEGRISPDGMPQAPAADRISQTGGDAGGGPVEVSKCRVPLSYLQRF